MAATDERVHHRGTDRLLKTQSAADEIAIVEAAYQLEGTETEWLERVVRVAAPCLDRGLGVAAVTVDCGPAGVRLRASASAGGRPGLSDAVVQLTREGGPAR
jgi:hypothetical protein